MVKKQNKKPKGTTFVHSFASGGRIDVTYQLERAGTAADVCLFTAIIRETGAKLVLLSRVVDMSKKNYSLHTVGRYTCNFEELFMLPSALEFIFHSDASPTKDKLKPGIVVVTQNCIWDYSRDMHQFKDPEIARELAVLAHDCLKQCHHTNLRGIPSYLLITSVDKADTVMHRDGLRVFRDENEAPFFDVLEAANYARFDLIVKEGWLVPASTNAPYNLALFASTALASREAEDEQASWSMTADD